MDLVTASLNSSRSAGTNERIPSREWAMGERRKVALVGKVRGEVKLDVELLERSWETTWLLIDSPGFVRPFQHTTECLSLRRTTTFPPPWTTGSLSGHS